MGAQIRTVCACAMQLRAIICWWDLAVSNGAEGRPSELAVSETMRPVVLSVRSFTGIEPIDGGDTVVVRFQAPDGREVALLVPKETFAEFRRLLDADP